MAIAPEPSRDCPLCPRLAAFRGEQRIIHPDWHNAPVPSFGDPAAWLAIVGLIGAFAVFVWYAWQDEHEHVIPVEEVRKNARERRRIRMEHLHNLSQST